ncbi:MAG: peptide chain release factor N(5)-glutamine methyltransferase [Desulfobacterales bacterium]
MQKPSDSQWTILDLIQWTTAYFKSHAIDSSRLTAELLLAHVLGIERIDLYARFDQPLTAEELAGFKQLIKRRLKREPVGYILGHKDFWDITVAVDPNVLIPRPETELLVEFALDLIPENTDARKLRILDLGTGSGAVILSLAAARPGHLFYASDADPVGLAVARQNALSNQLADQVGFFAGSWFAPIHPDIKFDLIVSNPPYIPAAEISGLAPEICNYEPLLALDGGADGLRAIRHIIETAPAYLSPEGRLLLEFGNGHAEKLQGLIETVEGIQLFKVIKDYSGYDRVVVAGRNS